MSDPPLSDTDFKNWFHNCFKKRTKVAQNVVDGIVGIDRSSNGLAAGKWGDSAGCSGAESCGTKWINVLEASAPNACSGFNLATGKHYKVLYQKTGSILDPQSQVISLRVVWLVNFGFMKFFFIYFLYFLSEVVYLVNSFMAVLTIFTTTSSRF